MSLRLSSPAFGDGDPIPQKYTGEGENISPPLEWQGAPDGVQSYVLIVEDPDAPQGTFRHWAIYDIAGECNRFPEGADAGAKTEQLGHGINDFGHRRYDGPLPPKGHGRHHYHFRLAALDVPSLDVGRTGRDPSVADVWMAARPHIIAQAELVGTYAR